MRALAGPRFTQSATSPLLLRRAPSSLPVLRDLLSGVAGERIRLELERAGLTLRPGEYVVIRVFLAATLFVVSLLILGMPGGLLLGLPLALLGLVLPAIYVRLKTAQRVAAINAQMSEALRMIANALRAGLALMPALQAAEEQLRRPLTDELSRLLADTDLGSNIDDSLRSFADRVGSYEARTMVTAIVVQRSTGGNLAEILDRVAEAMEERDRIHGEVRSFTAQQRLTGNILAAYPTLLALLFFVIHPSLMSLLFVDSIGRVLLAIGVTLQFTGFLAIRRILTIDY